jgi:hypothetical protein
MDVVEITLPVSRVAAQRLGKPDERARLGALVSQAVASEATEEELAAAVRLLGAPERARRAALRQAFAAMQEAAEGAEISPADVEGELHAWKRERGSQPR